MKLRAAAFAAVIAHSAIHLPAAKPRAEIGYRDWRVFGGGFDNIHYSTLSQIHRGNVSRLQVAWTFDTGDAFKGSEMQCNPIVIGRTLYATTPKGRVIALDAATGAQRWSFDPFEGEPLRGGIRNRGVAYWTDGAGGRIFYVARHTLYALDASSGKPAAGFGAGGRVDIREGLGRDAATLYVTATTPGVVYKDLLILGTLVPESLPSAPGDIRAYDVRTGKIRWSFHTIPHPGEFGYDTWPKEAWTYSGGANNWSGMALDVKRGLVFAPTGSASYDFYGANRHGDNLFANTLLALKADSGERVWHFQAVRHDVWDRDFPSAPALVTLRRNGRALDAVAQITKSGHVFVFERETGKPVFPIEMRAVPQSRVDGEKLSTMQPLPVKPPAFSRQTLTEDMLTRRTQRRTRSPWSGSAPSARTGSSSRPASKAAWSFRASMEAASGAAQLSIHRPGCCTSTPTRCRGSCAWSAGSRLRAPRPAGTSTCATAPAATATTWQAARRSFLPWSSSPAG